MRPSSVAAIASAALLLSLASAPAANAAPAKKQNAIAVSVAHSRIEQATPGWTKVKVTIKNTGKKTAKRIVVRASASKGARVTPGYVIVKSLKAGKRAAVTVKVKRVAGSGAVKITARSAAGARSTARISVTTPAPKPVSNPLIGHGYWQWDYQAYDSEAGYHHLYFVDGTFAYWGLLDAALPTCAAATVATLDPEAPGCLTYAYDAASGAVSIGGTMATLTPAGALAFPGDVTYDRIDYPDAGSVADLDLEHIGYSGCSGLPYCSTWTTEFATNAAGQFIRSESSLTTVDVPGGPFTAGGNYPPDSYGTYAIVSRGVIELRFADGHVERKVLGYLTNAAGATAPATEGVFLGAEYFWLDDD